MMKPISFPYQILGILIGFLLEFLYARGFLNGIKCYQLNRNAYKKRKKGETFKEWLFYDRWKNEIPKIFLIYQSLRHICHTWCRSSHVLSLLSTALGISGGQCHSVGSHHLGFGVFHNH